ncbi:MAG: peptidylprolyl isomerase [Clostridia bacterium]|nr:peptidylprolyl isomerase [Clostridia bacterium]
MKIKKIIALITAILCMMTLFTACGKEGEEQSMYVELELKKGGSIVMQMLPEYAPKTVAFFLELVEDNYYDGLVFHRAVKDFMIQGGSPNGDGIGGAGRTVKGEFASNGFDNKLSHTRGVVSMARTNVKDSASGQFFIVHGDSTFLDGNYAAFAKVVEGMEYVDEIANSAVNGETLIDKPVIKTIKVLKKYEPKQ